MPPMHTILSMSTLQPIQNGFLLTSVTRNDTNSWLSLLVVMDHFQLGPQPGGRDTSEGPLNPIKLTSIFTSVT